MFRKRNPSLPFLFHRQVPYIKSVSGQKLSIAQQQGTQGATRKDVLVSKREGKESKLRLKEKKSKRQNSKQPRIRNSACTDKHLHSQGSAADAVSGFLSKKALPDIKVSFHYSSTKLQNSRRVWLNITDPNSTTTYLQHWMNDNFIYTRLKTLV